MHFMIYIRVFDPNASRYFNQSLKQCYVRNEAEKKNQYNERVLEVENGCFTPLVFSIYGGMGRECQTFYHRLAEDIAAKKKQNLDNVISWIRTKLSFSLLRSCLLCIRGSRTGNVRSEECSRLVAEDIDVDHHQLAKI